MPSIKILFDENEQRLQLRSHSGNSDSVRSLEDRATAPADLVGHLNIIHADRIQVLGQPEIKYFANLSVPRQMHYAAEFLRAGAPAVIVCEGMEIPSVLIQMSEQNTMPLWVTPLSAAAVIDSLRSYLTRKLAPSVQRHGVLMDVLGMGVLITGDSGLGKSELALELVSRGHGLVADDVVDCTLVSADTIEGQCPSLLQNLLEVRGLGLLDIKTIIGETAVRRRMRLKLNVHLTRRAAYEEQGDRLNMDEQYDDILGVKIARVVLPVAAGRNLAVLLETAVRNNILKLRGIYTLDEFLLRQKREMQDNLN